MGVTSLGLTKKILFALIPGLLLLIGLEVVQRIRYFGFTDKVFYLNIANAFSSPQRAKPGPNIYEFRKVSYTDGFGGGYYKGVPGRYLHRFRDHEGKEKTVRYTINSRGFRSGEFSPVKGKNVKRLIVIGGSSTMGVESPDDDTFPARLERELRRRFPGRKYEVINAGFVGYFSNHLLSIVRGELLSYDPDVILMYASYNDTAHERHITQRPVRSGWWGVLYVAHFQLYRRSLLYITAVEKFSLWRTGNPVPSLGIDDRYRKRFQENILDLIQVCRSNKVKLIIILQPLALSEGVAEFLRGMSSDELAGLLRSGKFGAQAQALQSVRQKVLLAQLVEFAKTHGLDVVNPLPLFEENKARGRVLFEDIVHLTPEGNALLADFIAGTDLF